MKTLNKGVTINMRLIAQTLLALVLVFVFFSCENLLDVEVNGIVSENIYEDQSGIELALAGAYHNLGGVNDGFDGGELFGGDFILIPSLMIVGGIEMFWSTVGSGSEYSPFHSNSKIIAPTNSRLEANWRRGYETINTLNTILANIENIDDDMAKARINGETLAMRAILYFEMVRLWGPSILTKHQTSWGYLCYLIRLLR